MMSYQAIEAVLKHSQSKGSARLLLLCIAHRAQADGNNSRIGVDALAAQTKIDRREVRRLTRKLETSGELERRQGGGERANEYSLLLPIDASGAETSGKGTRTGTGTTGAGTSGGVGNTPPQQTVVETSVVTFEKSKTTLAAELESQGVAASVAIDLASRHAERIALQLDWLSDRKPKDAAATLVAAIRGNWDAPAAYRKRIEARAREEAIRAHQERETAAKAQQEAKKREETAHKEAEAAALDARFESLSESERAEIDATAIERLGEIGRLGQAQGALYSMRRTLLRERDS